MSTRTYELNDLRGDKTTTAVFAISPQIFTPHEVTCDGPKFLDIVGTDLSLDDVVLDLDDIYN